LARKFINGVIVTNSPTSFDLIVIGSGPGGYTAAIRAAQLKMKVAIVERDKLGGVCLNWGCIPTKALLKNAEFYSAIRRSEDWGISCDNIRFDFSKIIKKSRNAAERLNKGVEFLMKKNGIATYFGTAQLKTAGVVEVYDQGKNLKETLSTSRILLATGARPRALPGIEFDGKNVIWSTEAMVLPEPPKTMVIIGAGAIGVEFAYFYNAFGTEVTLVEMMPQILPVEDGEIVGLLAKSLKKNRIKILTETKVSSLIKTAEGVEVTVEDAKGSQSQIKAERALMSIGVRGNYDGMGLERLGVQVNRDFVKVNGDFQTNVPGIYAIGDIIGPPLLAHVASAEGVSAVEGMAGVEDRLKVNYENIPGCTYCQPQVASVGLTEEKARQQGHTLKIGRFPFRASGKAIAIGETEGLVKLIFDATYGELIGAHILGSEATEMIAELALAKNLEATYQEILHTVHAHPTLSETVMEAAGDAYGESLNQ
jgi:dihydrolipoamide dehydrogenase